MNKRELTKKVAERSGHTQATSALIINTFISCILESLEAGEKVTIQDFGTLAVKQQKTRERFNLITKKVEKYSSYDYIKFITSTSAFITKTHHEWTFFAIEIFEHEVIGLEAKK